MTGSHPNLERFLSLLRKVNRTSTGWTACCPAHGDEHPSLSINIGHTGGIVVHCHSQNCSADNIATAVGMRLLDFAPEPPQAEIESSEESWESRIERTYDYHDEAGQVLYQVCRLRNPKDFKQRRRSGRKLNRMIGAVEDQFSWKLGNVRRVPYCLPELLAKPEQWILIVEGEKDADNLRKLSLLATTNAQGAGKWHTLDQATVKRTFAGRKVAVFRDNDGPGVRHQIQVCEALASIAAEVRVVALPGNGKDVTDWILAGNSDVMPILQLAPRWDEAEKSRLEALAQQFEQRERERKAAQNPSTNGKHEFPAEKHLTDAGNALRFAEQHRDNVRYCDQWKSWLIWTGSHWQEDQNKHIDMLAKMTVRTILAEARTENAKAEKAAARQQADGINADDTDKSVKANDLAGALAKHALKSEHVNRIQAMLRLAQSELPITPAEMDKDQYLFNCLNGTLELKTGIFRPHKREDNLTRVAPVEYHPEAKCPQFEMVLRSIFPESPLENSAPGDTETIQFVQRFFGLCLSGNTSEQVLAIFHGFGSNGKSTILETVCSILGPYAGPAPEGLLLIRRGEQHPTELADLFGRRLVHSTETGEGARLDEARVKKLTGCDEIQARRMRENFWRFLPTHKLIISTNHRPKIKGTDHAIWRRVLLVPFVSKFWKDTDQAEPGEVRLERFRRRDEYIHTKFEAEKSGILNWLLAGFQDWQRNGLRPPQSVQVASNEYRASMDTIGRFVEEMCKCGNKEKERTSELYKSFLKWAEENGENSHISRREFTLRLLHITGAEAAKDRSARYAKGIRLLTVLEVQMAEDFEEQNENPTLPD